jgi:hypothetical protein
MFTRIVRCLCFLFFVAPAYGAILDYVEVPLPDGSSPSAIARLYTGNAANFTKFSYFHPETGRVIELVDPKTYEVSSVQYRLPVNTKIRIPQELVAAGASVTKNSNTQREGICGQYALGAKECRVFQIANKQTGLQAKAAPAVPLPNSANPKPQPSLPTQSLESPTPAFWDNYSRGKLASLAVALFCICALAVMLLNYLVGLIGSNPLPALPKRRRIKSHEAYERDLHLHLQQFFSPPETQDNFVTPQPSQLRSEIDNIELKLKESFSIPLRTDYRKPLATSKPN